jgi:hypothetical protein
MARATALYKNESREECLAGFERRQRFRLRRSFFLSVTLAVFEPGSREEKKEEPHAHSKTRSRHRGAE